MRSQTRPPAPKAPPKTNAELYILIGCFACALLACAALTVLMFVGAVVLFPEERCFRGSGFQGHHGNQLSAFAAGTTEPDFELYGRTLDNEVFDWDSLRGQYVLVKFTATWCPPCKEAIPYMLAAYEQFRHRGFEIVSVYIEERGVDPVATVRQFVEREQLPWIILSEFLTERAGQPPQGTVFGIQLLPTMILVDTEGAIIAVGPRYKEELRRVFAR